MAAWARRNGNLVFTVRLTLQPGRDDDLILLIQNAPRGALAGIIREAMRTGITSGSSAFSDAPQEQPLDLSSLGTDL